MTDQSSKQASIRTITLLARYGSLGKIREFVADSAQTCGLVPAAVYAVQLAVDEAFTNIIEHAYGGECYEEIQCACQIEAGRLTIKLRDCGRPFSPGEVPDPDTNAALEQRQAGGLGLYFMRNLMDEVHFTFIPETNDEGCNILTMVKTKEKGT